MNNKEKINQESAKIGIAWANVTKAISEAIKKALKEKVGSVLMEAIAQTVVSFIKIIWFMFFSKTSKKDSDKKLQ